jgi:hypothetical protein
MRTPLLTTISILALMAAGAAEAAPLSSYRAKLANPEQVKGLEKAAEDRVNSLREALGTIALDRSGLKAATSPFAKIGASTPNKGTKKTGSGIIKTLLGQTAEKLRQREEEGAPPPFDPSKFMYEIEQERVDRRMKFCEENLGKEYVHIVGELSIDLMKTAPVAEVVAKPTALHTELTTGVAGLIPTAISDKLGRVTDVDYVDGKVIKIYFTNSKSEVTPVSFSTLATVRTLRDKYFLIVFECIRQHVEAKSKEEKPQDEGYQGLTKAILPAISARFTTAVEISQRLGTLSKQEMNTLIDVFLSLAGTDVPTEEEMTAPDDPKAWKVGSQPPSLPAYIYQLSQPAIVARDKALDLRKAALGRKDKKAADAAALAAERTIAPVATELADYQYYHLMDDQLGQLADWLFEEKAREKQEQKRIDDMGVGQ